MWRKRLFSQQEGQILMYAQLAVLNQQLLQRKQQIDEIRVNITTSEETHRELLYKQIEIIEPLVKSGLSQETELLSLLRRARDFKEEVDGSKASLVRAKSSIVEVEQEISSIKWNHKTNSQSELSKWPEIAEVGSRIPALEDRVIHYTS